MKYFSTLIVVLLTASGAYAQASVQETPTPTETAYVQQSTLPAKEADKRARKAKRNAGPEVYKGTLAQQRRIIIDAPDAQRDDEPQEEDKKLRSAGRDKLDASISKP